VVGIIYTLLSKSQPLRGVCQIDPLKIAAYILGALFVIGGAGCLIAIPVIAHKMFSVLFEKDEEENVRPA
jgi:hypothetical protein